MVVDWVAPDADPRTPAMATLRELIADEAELLAPRLLSEEVANALLTGVRRRRWSGAAADGAFRALSTLPVRIVEDSRDIARAWDLARRHDDHPFYDMVYVAVAERTGTTLITADDALRKRLMMPWVVGPGNQV